MEQDNKKVSILSVFYNDKKLLEKTIKSVLSQDYPNIEHIIIDGGSTDGSVELIKEMEPFYHGRLKWISEKDKGIYDAYGKACKLMTGDIIGTITDVFCSTDAVSSVVKAIQENDADGCYGGLIIVKNKKVIRRWSGKAGNIYLGWMPATPTLFLTKEIFWKDNHGLFKTNYKGASDYERSIRLIRNKAIKLVGIQKELVALEYGGTSTGGLPAAILGIREGHRALVENNVRFAWFVDICRIIRTILTYIFVRRKEVTI